jgi:hypothetical protein
VCATSDLPVSLFVWWQIDENVAREIINHRSLRHPNIIRFKEVCAFVHVRDIYIYIYIFIYLFLCVCVCFDNTFGCVWVGGFCLSIEDKL